MVTDSKQLKRRIGSCAVMNLHSGREHPPRDETVLHPLHRNILFPANGRSLVQVFDNNVLKIFQIRVGGVLEFGHGFHTRSAHRHDDTWDKSTPIAGFFIPNARSALVSMSHAVSPNSALPRGGKSTFLPFAGGGKYSGPNTSTDLSEKSFDATLFDMISVR